ncbi:MAG TPA: DUF1304 family protein [Nocardioidaceae bacterium]|nr:DUF1304 family protein [Nocardioidaceae bacterium]
MNALAQSAAVISALIYIAVFPTEAFLVERPAVQRFLRIAAANVADIRLWAFSVGFRNLFAGIAALVGVVLLNTGDEVVGQTLVLASCAYMFLAGITMGFADWLGYYPHKGDGIPGTVAASLPPLVALVAALF